MEVDAKQAATDALLVKFRAALDLELVEGLPGGVYDFDPTGWMLFRVRGGSDMVGPCEYVAVRRETGEVRLLQYANVADVGKAIHPLSCKCQLDGGAIMGLGNTFYEEMVYQDGQMVNVTSPPPATETKSSYTFTILSGFDSGQVLPMPELIVPPSRLIDTSGDLGDKMTWDLHLERAFVDGGLEAGTEYTFQSRILVPTHEELDQVEGFSAGRSLAHDDEPGLALQHVADARPDDGMIVGDEHPDRCLTHEHRSP